MRDDAVLHRALHLGRGLGRQRDRDGRSNLKVGVKVKRSIGASRSEQGGEGAEWVGCYYLKSHGHLGNVMVSNTTVFDFCCFSCVN